MTASVLRCKEQQLPLTERTLIMGILNVTPDSFSDGGRYVRVETAVERARQMVVEGADIIDIGGESTRPGAETVTQEEELRRVVPAVRAIREAGIKAPISIDTYKAEVARQALEAGADIINDIWGLQKDLTMAAIAASYNTPIVLMHNRLEAVYANFIQDVLNDLKRTVERALEAGIREEQIILDPGIGFAKSYEQNLQLMNRLDKVAALGYPVLLGTSRKRMIHQTLQLPPDEVVFGTAATSVYGIVQGCRILRVHDVQAAKQTAVMTDAMLTRR